MIKVLQAILLCNFLVYSDYCHARIVRILLRVGRVCFLRLVPRDSRSVRLNRYRFECVAECPWKYDEPDTVVT